MNIFMVSCGMRKTFLTVSVFFAFSGFVFSQCNPQWVDSGFVYPYADSFHCIEKGVAYSNSFQINMPIMFHGLVTLDSLSVDSIIGLPNGITWSSSPYPLTLHGDSSGCVTLSGTDTVAADTGKNFNLTFYCHAVVTSQSAGTQQLNNSQLLQLGDAPIPAYWVSVIDTGDICHPYNYNTGLRSLSSSAYVHIFPNPLSAGNFHVRVGAEMIGAKAELFDADGQLVSSSVITNSQFEVLSNGAAGLYLLRIHAAGFSISKKLLKL